MGEAAKPTDQLLNRNHHPPKRSVKTFLLSTLIVLSAHSLTHSLSIHPSTHLPTHSPTHPPTYLPTHLPTYLPTHPLPIYPPTPTYPPTYPLSCLSVFCLSIHPNVRLFIGPSTHPVHRQTFHSPIVHPFLYRAFPIIPLTRPSIIYPLIYNPQTAYVDIAERHE